MIAQNIIMLSGLRPLQLLQSTMSARTIRKPIIPDISSDDDDVDDEEPMISTPTGSPVDLPPSPEHQTPEKEEYSFHSPPNGPVVDSESEASVDSRKSSVKKVSPSDLDNEKKDEAADAEESPMPPSSISKTKPAKRTNTKTNPVSPPPKDDNIPPKTETTKKRKRLTPMEKASEASLSTAQELVHLTETVWKSKQDALKSATRELKAKQEELKKLEAQYEALRKDTVAALQQKREASSKVKKLSKNFETWKTNEKKEMERKEALKAAARRTLASSIEGMIGDEITTKKTKKEKGNVNNCEEISRKKRRKIAEELDSEEDANGAYSSGSDDSDWEGTTKVKQKSNETPDTSHRSRRVSRNPSQWVCKTCTFAENALTSTECEICMEPRS